MTVAKYSMAVLELALQASCLVYGVSNMGEMMKFGLMVSTAAVLMAPMAAQAGPDSESLFSRDRNISVLERPREGYEPLGIRTGQFIVRPRMDITAAYTDNVFSISDDVVAAFPGFAPFADQDDLYFIFRPSVVAESDWNNHSVRSGAYLEGFHHLDFDNENVTNGGLFVDGTLDVYTNVMLMAGLSFDLLHESRDNSFQPNILTPLVGSSNGTLEEPVEYERTNLYVGGQQELGRVRYRGRVDFRSYDYDDADSVTGFSTPRNQQFRDRNEYIAMGQVGWALTRDASVFLRGTYNVRDHDIDGNGFGAGGLNRDSSGWAMLLGLDFDISKLLRGNLGIGYMEQEFDDTELPNGGGSLAGTSIDGISFDGGIEWFPTEMTTIGLSAKRAIRDSQLFEAVGFTAEEFGVRVDHELRRNIVLSASVTAGRDEYEGIDLEYDRIEYGVGGTYFINRTLRANLNFTHESQEAGDFLVNGNPGFAREFERNQVFLTLTAQR